jgi:hypothetical protein
MNKLNPDQAYQAALQADDHIREYDRSKGEFSYITEYKDTILKLRLKDWPYIKIAEFLKETCGVEKGASHSTIFKYLKSLENESGKDDNNTGTTGNRENYAVAHAVGTSFQTISTS